MKLVYAVDRGSFNDKNHLGVKKKVESQIHFFEENDIETNLCQYVWIKGYPQIIINKDTDILYFRRIEPSLKFVLILYKIKKVNPRIKIVMEIPTYPFDKEELGKKSLKRRLSIKFGELFMRFFIDCVIIIGTDKKINSIYGIHVITALNGIDLSQIQIAKVKSKNNNEINAVCVSGCYFWHGYERFIEGMADYYKNERDRKIYLHVVGEGECLESYIALAKKKLLDKYVIFYGNKTGSELDEIYNHADIAIDCLATHRKNLYFTSSLKAREYVAKGIPVVTSARLDIEKKDRDDYIFKVSPNEEPIDIEAIIGFYDSIYRGKEKEIIRKNVRELFADRIDWKYTYSEVINYIKQK